MTKSTATKPFEDTPRGRKDAAEQFQATVNLAMEHITSLAAEFPDKYDRRRFISALAQRLRVIEQRNLAAVVHESGLRCHG